MVIIIIIDHVLRIAEN